MPKVEFLRALRVFVCRASACMERGQVMGEFRWEEGGELVEHI